MNIEVIEPFDRLELAGSRVSALKVVSGSSGAAGGARAAGGEGGGGGDTLWVGFSNGDIAVYRLAAAGAAAAAAAAGADGPRVPRPRKSLADVRRQFGVGVLPPVLTAPNVTVSGSAVRSIEPAPAAVSGAVFICVADADTVRVHRFDGDKLKFVHEFAAAGFVDLVWASGSAVAIGTRKRVAVAAIDAAGEAVIVHEATFKEKVKRLRALGDEVVIGTSGQLFTMDAREYAVVPLSGAEAFAASAFSYFGLNSSGPHTLIEAVHAPDVVISQDTQMVRFNRDTRAFSPVAYKPATVPLAMCYIAPIYLCVAFARRLEVVDYSTGSVVQTFEHHLGAHVQLAVGSRRVFAGGGTDVLRFEVASSEAQLAQYLYYYEAATAGEMQLAGLERAIAYMDKLDTDDAAFGDGGAKRKALRLRELYSAKAVLLFAKYHRYHEALVEIGLDWLVDVRTVLELFPAFLSGEPREAGEAGEAVGTRDGANAVRSVTLAALREHDDSGTDEKSHSEAGSGGDGATTSPALKRFRRAVSNLIVYLTDQRRIVQHFEQCGTMAWHGVELEASDVFGESPQSAAVTVDTSLFLCYFHTKPMMLGPLLRLPNNKCDASVVNRCLLQDLHAHSTPRQPSGYLRELLDFYYGRRLHREALTMLQQMAHDAPLDHTDEFDQYLRGPDLTVQYLQKLDNSQLDLVFEYARWVLEAAHNPEAKQSLCASIFMNDSYECESYDSFKVLEFLGKDDALVAAFLEWLIASGVIAKYRSDPSAVAKLHTRLCLTYVGQLKRTERFDSPAYRGLERMLDTTRQYEPWTVLRSIPTSDTRFLRLAVLVYKRLGEHDKSVDVLFNQLDDLDAAMAYCAAIYSQPHQQVLGQRLLHKLLEDLIGAGGGSAAIERLLNQEGVKMSHTRVLQVLPAAFPVARLASYLSTTLRAFRENVDGSRITSQLYKVGTIKLKAQVLESQSAHVAIKSGAQECCVCNKRLGYSVFSVSTKGAISHYGCDQGTQ
ncbi:CNH domain-containing protein [[Candida] zeylanoides]